jgi:two-component system, LuxR family, sensor histidine kinase DctS
MLRRFSFHQVLFACFAAVAILPGVSMFLWDEWIAIDDVQQEVERAGHSLILIVSVATAIVTGWILSRRVAQEEFMLRQQEHQLAHAMRLAVMGEMASAIAHEINQPLAAIAAYVDGCLLRLRAGEAPNGDILDALDKAAEQARRAGMVLRRVRGFVRDASPGRALIDVNEPVREAIELVASEARMAGAELKVTLAESELPVSADSIQIQQIILSLTRDGLEAMADQAPKDRRIQIETVRSEDGTVRLRVRAQGARSTRATDLRMLDPFFATESGGRDMELSICRSIAEAHDGRLDIEHPEEGGARFELVLPLARQQRD